MVKLTPPSLTKFHPITCESENQNEKKKILMTFNCLQQPPWPPWALNVAFPSL